MIAPVIKLNPGTNLLRQREFKQPADIFVRIGQKVHFEDVLGEETLACEYFLLNIAEGLGIDKLHAMKRIVVRQGEPIHAGDLVAGPLGVSRRVVRSPIEGHVLLVYDHEVILQKNTKSSRVEACFPGEIIDIHEHRVVTIGTTGALFEGVWGNGGITFGKLNCFNHENEGWDNSRQNQDLIIYLSTCMKTSTLEYFAQNTPKALVLGSCSPHLVSIILSLPFPVIILIGFNSSETNPESIQQIAQFEGSMVTVDAVNFDYHQDKRPALLIPHTAIKAPDDFMEAGNLQPGSRVRITMTPYFGLCGTIIDFVEGSDFSSGIRADCALVKLSNKEIVKAPIFNLEILA